MRSIDLLRKNGTEIENECQFNSNENLGVIFSGFGYTYRNPLLYYSRNILFDHNIDYLGVDCKYYNDKYFMNLTGDEQDKYFEEDIKIIINKLLEIERNYRKVILIGKSMGTTIIKKCLQNEQIRRKSSAIFITPGTDWENIINVIKYINNNILVIGSFRDKFYNIKNLSEIYDRKNIYTYELKEGDHSLETNDTIKDIEQLKKIMEEIKRFINENIFGD
ncbi:alpha/beta hydrolase [Spirochaetia bacterium]|nr:alpha/beta hydrolase [Spirochaetia bacterium]